MLSLEKIKKYYSSDLIDKFPRNILTEYLQYELLDSIFKQKGSEKLSFMGGTAIRIIYEGNRFSEDLDFDNFELSFNEFKKIIQQAIANMGKKGFLTEIRFVKKEAFHCYIRFLDILQKEGLAKMNNEKILMRVDAVLKEKRFHPQIILLNKFGVYCNILVDPLDIILSQKMLAGLNRKRAKGRDFYDISFLYGITKPNFKYIEGITELTEKDFLDQFKKHCLKLDFKQLAKDIEPFLIDKQIERVKGFNKFLQNI